MVDSLAERLFSYLKRIKNCLQATLREENLNDLASLSIESDLMDTIHFEGAINEFAEMKNHKKMF